VDDRTRSNWLKVMQALQAAGKIDSMFYRRAVIIVKTGHDPGEQMPPFKL